MMKAAVAPAGPNRKHIKDDGKDDECEPRNSGCKLHKKWGAHDYDCQKLETVTVKQMIVIKAVPI